MLGHVWQFWSSLNAICQVPFICTLGCIQLVSDFQSEMNGFL